MKAYKGPTGLYVMEIPKAERHEVARAQAYRGMAFSLSASTAENAVMFSPDPYSCADIAEATDPDLGAFRRAIDLSRALEGSRKNYRTPPGKELWPYQGATLEYLLERGGGIDADQPGLGKTPTSIVFCNELDARRVIVVVPASVRIQWGMRIKEWSTIPNVKVSVMLKVKDGIHPNAHYQVLSYEAARNPAILKAIGHSPWDVMICDEAHKMKSSEALTTRAVIGNRDGMYQTRAGISLPAISASCKHSIALTGTPLLNRPSECFDKRTLVLTQRGWVPIVKVKISDMLWDGVEWVGHCGLLYQGCAPTVNVGKILATATHRFRVKSSWVKADEVRQNTVLWRQALASGSENLPLQAFGNTRAVLKLSGAFVIAAEKLTQRFKNLGKIACFNADRAAHSTDHGSAWVNTSKFAQTENYAQDSFQPYNQSGTGQQIQKTMRGNPTEDEASVYGLHGWRTGRFFWRILFLCLGTKFQVWNWIGKITIKDMNPEICDILPKKKIWLIDARSMICNLVSTWPWKRSKCLKPVYDLANAGPRKRFTILSADGPVIVHNCYVLFRFFDWQSIDYLSEEKFKDKFNKQADLKTIEGKRYKIESTSLELELQNRLRINVMARHEKKDVFSQMKQPRYSVVTVGTDGKVSAALAVEGMLGLDIEEIQTSKNITFDGHIAEARRLMGEAMAPQIIEYAYDFLEGSEEKLVIFCWHISVIAMFEAGLSDFGTVTVHGGKSPLARQKAIDDFISDPNIRVWISNMQAGGEGVDGLQKVCSRVYLAEPDWVPSRNEQAVARLDRIGQAFEVVAEVFTAAGSIAEKILVKALEKMNVIHRVLDEKGKRK